MKLRAHFVHKPWGRTDIASVFGGSLTQPVGEIWFEHPEDQTLPLLVKYLFTSERLSVQVHPNDQEAQSRGLARGKDECWYIMDAEKDATLALGLRSPVSSDKLRAAAQDGSIVDLLNWRPAAPGDFFYVPAGTVHAIGAGIMLVEVQQNSNATFRLYDYGRLRELHLDDALAVTNLGEFPAENFRRASGPVNAVLVDGPHFSLLRASSVARMPRALSSLRRWVIPLRGRASSNGESAAAGECLLLLPGEPLSLSDSAMALIAAEKPSG